MTTDQWHAVTVNLGCGGPHSSDDRDRVLDWLGGVAGTYEVVFAQEMPHDEEWRGRWTDYIFAERRSPRYRPRSAVIVHKDITVIERPLHYPTADYHDSYVVGAVVEGPDGETLALMSVHASPNPVSTDWSARWAKCGVDRSLPDRSCGLWDSDLVLESVRHVAEHSGAVGLIAAGDWNEARHWDDGDRHRVKGGREFFRNVEAVGLDDRCCPEGAHEAEARDGLTTSHGLHLDHVFTSRSVSDRVVVTGVGSEAPADHRPVEFTIG